MRISNNGEFIHGYGPSVWAQGNTNVSHGCVNLSPDNAKIYFDRRWSATRWRSPARTKQLDAADGDYYDWAISWDEVGRDVGAGVRRCGA